MMTIGRVVEVRGGGGGGDGGGGSWLDDGRAIITHLSSRIRFRKEVPTTCKVICKKAINIVCARGVRIVSVVLIELPKWPPPLPQPRHVVETSTSSSRCQLDCQQKRKISHEFPLLKLMLVVFADNTTTV